MCHIITSNRLIKEVLPSFISTSINFQLEYIKNLSVIFVITDYKLEESGLVESKVTAVAFVEPFQVVFIVPIAVPIAYQELLVILSPADTVEVLKILANLFNVLAVIVVSEAGISNLKQSHAVYEY